MADDKVSIACKLPAGLTIRHDNKVVTLKGSNSEGAVAGFGITKDVDSAWFADWCEKGQHPAVRNGAIFANTAAKVGGEAKEKRDDVVSGLEPLDPAKPGPGVEPVANIGG